MFGFDVSVEGWVAQIALAAGTGKVAAVFIAPGPPFLLLYFGVVIFLGSLSSGQHV